MADLHDDAELVLATLWPLDEVLQDGRVETSPITISKAMCAAALRLAKAVRKPPQPAAQWPVLDVAQWHALERLLWAIWTHDMTMSAEMMGALVALRRPTADEIVKEFRPVLDRMIEVK